MSCGIVGRKYEMTRTFQGDGVITPITYVKCHKNIIKQVKTVEKNGYKAIVLASDPYKKQTKTKKFRVEKEFPVDSVDNYSVGNEIDLSSISEGTLVTVKSIAKGKGFQGVIKRHNFSRGPETHGSDHHRAPGSIGACAEPGRVVKGKKLPGRMGGQSITLKNIAVIKIDKENDLIALKGSIPGAKNSIIQLIVQ